MFTPQDEPLWDFNLYISKIEKWISRVKVKYKEKERDDEILAKENKKLEREVNGLCTLVKGYQNALIQNDHCESICSTTQSPRNPCT
ncbi:hypothetical protein AQUCO_00300133v1 [Aquilegia coerulea]|uniref:Uncharacterized protein n=1 Tax=Aquilegia coerulea TaxID=218851 RepID=A0A2G5EXC9_AQUCA|nr:hypothetical protein AQUCO_00300133v1 [Aquilegia coerulea]